ncbi:MAG: extracellular solute-binding protein [Oscillospiraceae bacterium]|nr:extracellular solute-binding protein [Oscillospiraceae bacterium]
MKRKIIGLLGASLIMFSVLSCNRTEKHNVKNTTDHTNEGYSYTVDDNPVFDTNKILCFKLLDTYNDGYVFYGLRYSADDEFKINTVNITGSENTVSNFQIKETEIAVTSVKKYKNEILALSYYNGIYTVWVFDEYGNTQKRLDLDYYPGDIEVVNDCVYMMDYVNDKVKKYSGNLELINEYNIESDTLVPQFLRISYDENIYCLLSSKSSDESRIICIDEHEKSNVVKPADMDVIVDFYPDKSGNIVVMGEDNNSENVLLIDYVGTDGKIFDMSEIRDCNSVLGMTSSGDIVYENSFSISRHSENGEEVIYRYSMDDSTVYSVNVDEEDVHIFQNSATTNTDAVFVVDGSDNIVGEYATGAVTDAAVSGTDIFYIYQKMQYFGVGCIKDGKITDTGIGFEDASLNNITVTENNDIILSKTELDGTELLLSYDSAFKPISQIEVKGGIADIASSKNILYVFGPENIFSTDNNFKTENQLNELTEMKDDFHCLAGCNEYDVIIENGGIITGYNFGDNSQIVIADKRDILRDNITSLLIRNNQLLINDLLGIYKASRIEQSAEDDSTNETVLKLGCFSTDNEFRNAVKEFNAQNDLYKVVIIDYYDDDEYDEALSKFDTDILSGNIPDLVIQDRCMTNMPAYVRNGLFTDLYDFMMDDDELNTETTNENIIKAFERDEKLYIMPVLYSLQTVTASSDNNGMTLPQYLDSMSEDEKPLLADIMGQDLWKLTGVLLDTSYSSGKQRLSETDIKSLIKFFDKYRQESDYLDYGEFPGYDVYNHMYPFSFGSPSEFNMGVYYDYHENYDTGYTDDISGTVILRTGFSITEKSENKDAAWSFIKYISQKNNLYYLTGTNYYNILKKNNLKPDVSEFTKVNLDKYNRIMEGRWLNIYYDFDVIKIISDELYMEDDLSVDEKCNRIMNSLNKYYDEVW